MKINNPMPQPLPKECEKAVRIFKSFVDGANNGLDGVIPRHILEHARGFAIFTVFKAGFVLSARAGSGIVIARLDDGSWSAPSAIGLAGLGVGSQVGAEMTDFLIVLNSQAAIRTFMAAGSLTLGGNLSVALGPLGRNGEAAGAVSTRGKLAAMYSYSKTRGLFGGVSLEGSVIVERQDANHQAYKSPVTSRLLLGGMVEPPAWTESLIQTLDSCTGLPRYKKWVDDNSDPFMDGDYAFGSQDNSAAVTTSSKSRSFLKKKRPESAPFPPATWERATDSGAYFYDDADQNLDYADSRFDTVFDSNYGISDSPSQRNPQRSGGPYPFKASSSLAPSSHTRSSTLPASLDPFASVNRTGASLYGEMVSSQPELRITGYDILDEDLPRAIALYNFQAVEPGDLSFFKGDIITVTQMSDKTDDWWTGKLGDRSGIFPANFVEVA